MPGRISLADEHLGSQRRTPLDKRAVKCNNRTSIPVLVQGSLDAEHRIDFSKIFQNFVEYTQFFQYYMQSHLCNWFKACNTVYCVTWPADILKLMQLNILNLKITMYVVMRKHFFIIFQKILKKYFCHCLVFCKTRHRYHKN